MEAFVSDVALKGAVIIEAVACAIVFAGAMLALVRLIPIFATGGTFSQKRMVYRQFGMSLLFGLEFELAADVIRSAISPSWTDIAQLGAIAAIRTFLNYFLTKDIEKIVPPPDAPSGPPAWVSDRSP